MPSWHHIKVWNKAANIWQIRHMHVLTEWLCSIGPPFWNNQYHFFLSYSLSPSLSFSLSQLPTSKPINRAITWNPMFAAAPRLPSKTLQNTVKHKRYKLTMIHTRPHPLAVQLSRFHLFVTQWRWLTQASKAPRPDPRADCSQNFTNHGKNPPSTR